MAPPQRWAEYAAGVAVGAVGGGSGVGGSLRRRRVLLATAAALLAGAVVLVLLSGPYTDATVAAAAGHPRGGAAATTAVLTQAGLDPAPALPALAGLTHLIVVACHAVFLGHEYRSMPADIYNESNWILEAYQSGQVRYFVEHIAEGLERAAQDFAALLVFSGGQTRPRAGPRSEAQSYWEVAALLGWAPSRSAQEATDVAARATTEEFARDSLENLLFSLCRFYELTGRYPERVTVISFPHKRERFEQVHRRAAAFPAERFEFVGIGPPPPDVAVAFEHALVHEQFSKDPYACHGPLREKRLSRNPQRRTPPYAESCPALRGLLSYCGPGFYTSRLPW